MLKPFVLLWNLKVENKSVFFFCLLPFIDSILFYFGFTYTNIVGCFKLISFFFKENFMVGLQ